MKTISRWLLLLLFAGCAAPKVGTTPTELQRQYLADLPATRMSPWGPCECTYHFLTDTGAAGVPVVIQALNSYSGKTNDSMRALIVGGAWHYSRGTNWVVAPIMEQAARDPAAKVNAQAKKWLDSQREKNSRN